MREGNGKKIFQTVFLIGLLALVIYMCWFSFSLVADLKFGEASSPVPDDMEVWEGEMVMVELLFVEIALLAPILLNLICSVLNIIISLICLMLSVHYSRCSESKPVRVIDIVLSCLFALGIASGITAIVLLRVL